MKRSKLRNNFLKKRTEEINRQWNYCVPLLGKSKRGYYENLNIKNVTDNKLRIRDGINISEKGEILKTFLFSEVNIEDLKKDIIRLDNDKAYKAYQHSDIPIKIIKENLDIFCRLPTFYVQTSIALSNHLHFHLV